MKGKAETVVTEKNTAKSHGKRHTGRFCNARYGRADGRGGLEVHCAGIRAGHGHCGHADECAAHVRNAIAGVAKTSSVPLPMALAVFFSVTTVSALPFIPADTTEEFFQKEILAKVQ